MFKTSSYFRTMVLLDPSDCGSDVRAGIHEYVMSKVSCRGHNDMHAEQDSASSGELPVAV